MILIIKIISIVDVAIEKWSIETSGIEKSREIGEKADKIIDRST